MAECGSSIKKNLYSEKSLHKYIPFTSLELWKENDSVPWQKSNMSSCWYLLLYYREVGMEIIKNKNTAVLGLYAVWIVL